METLYASLAGSVSFVLIAYGSYWYFSPPKPAGNPVTESGSSPSRAVGAIPADTMAPAPVVVQPAAQDNASPLPSVPSRSAPPTPTAYGSVIGADPRNTAPTVQDDEDGQRKFRARSSSTQRAGYKKPTREERRRMRSRPEDD